MTLMLTRKRSNSKISPQPASGDLDSVLETVRSLWAATEQADAVVQNWGQKAIIDGVARLPATIFRAKGLVNLVEKPDHPCILQSTGKRATLTVGKPWGERVPKTQLVFIGSKGGVDGTWIEHHLTVKSMLERTEQLSGEQ